jgi:hypothetical protein
MMWTTWGMRLYSMYKGYQSKHFETFFYYKNLTQNVLRKAKYAAKITFYIFAKISAVFFNYRYEIFAENENFRENAQSIIFVSTLLYTVYCNLLAL